MEQRWKWGKWKLSIFRIFSLVYEFLTHKKDRKRRLEFMEYTEVKWV